MIRAAGLLCLVCSPLFGADDAVFPGEEWERASPGDVGLDAVLLRQSRDYALTGKGSGYITRHGRLVLSWGDVDRTYDLKSTTKAIGVTAFGLAISDGKVRMEDKAVSLHPSLGTPPDSNQASGWLNQVTLQHLATQTAGFEKPGGYGKLLFAPGSRWHYSDAGPNWLAECLTLTYGQDMDELLFDRVFTPIGITRKDLRWRKNQYRDHQIAGVMRREFGSGIHANVDAMARIGLLYLNEGRWTAKQLIPADFVRVASRPVKAVVGLPEYDGGEKHGNASDHYGLLWWNNADGTLADVPRDAYWSWGLHDSLIVVIPSLDLVVSRAGKGWSRSGWSGHYDVLKPFLEPIARAATKTKRDSTETTSGERPRIVGIKWAPPETILRKAKGSDNWPLTWGDDDAMYTAYGDGWGFDPRVPSKLSLGLAKVTGGPKDFQGFNIRSESGETTGDGPRGAKASGMLMVEGVLYLLARNLDNARLAWSTDHGKNWTWSDWRFETSFGCPSFVNFGRNYTGAPDGFIYLVSFDSDSAYEPADRLVLARVPQDRITHRSAYAFFAGTGEAGDATWTADVKKRGAILDRPRKCYRCSVTYNEPLRAYLMAMLPGGDTRERGGLAIYTAENVWGPWRTIYETEEWDVGPGESASFPVKWTSADGRTVHLVFSGGDCFSVRQARLQIDGGSE